MAAVPFVLLWHCCTAKICQVLIDDLILSNVSRVLRKPFKHLSKDMLILLETARTDQAAPLFGQSFVNLRCNIVL